MSPSPKPHTRILTSKPLRAKCRKDGEGYQANQSAHYIQRKGESSRWEVLDRKGGSPVNPVGEVKLSDTIDPSIHGYKSLGDARAAVAVLQAEARGDSRRARAAGSR